MGKRLMKASPNYRQPKSKQGNLPEPVHIGDENRSEHDSATDSTLCSTVYNSYNLLILLVFF